MNLDQAGFKKMMSDAGVHGDSAAWFKKIDSKGAGTISLDDLFSCIVGGNLFERYGDRFSKMDWTSEEFSCHHPVIDKDHRKLFELINAISSAVQSGKITNVSDALDELRNFSEVHCTNELKLMREAGCDRMDPALFDILVKTHRAVVDKMAWYNTRCRENEMSAIYDILTGEVNAFMKTWLRSHIRDCDRACAMMRSKGVCK